MRIEDLASKLQQPYSAARGYGIEKGQTEHLKNIWFVIPPPPPDGSPSGLKASLLQKANRILTQLPKLESLDSLDRLVLGLLVKREALQSSRMEGTFSTIEQVLTPGELFDRQEKSARASVVGYAHALESAFTQASKHGVKLFTADFIRKMHREMMSHDPEYRGKPGLFRNEIGKGVYATIGGLGRPENSVYNPCPPKRVLKSLRTHLAWLSDDARVELSRAGMGPSLLISLARGHWHFEAIHPFPDGNGRVGRMLMTLQMVCEGFAPIYLSGYIEANKPEYLNSLKQAQTQLDETALIHFMADAVIASWEESRITKSMLISLPERWSERGKFRGDSAAKRALTELLKTPIVTIKHLEKKLGVSNPAALRAINQLCESKILRERTGFARNRIFATEEVIELLARPFGEPPETALQKAASLFT